MSVFGASSLELSWDLALRHWDFFRGDCASALAPALQLRDVASACRGSDSAETRSLLQRLRWRCFKGSRAIALTSSSHNSRGKLPIRSWSRFFPRCKATRTSRTTRSASHRRGASAKRTAAMAWCSLCSSRIARCLSRLVTAWKARCRTRPHSTLPSVTSSHIFGAGNYEGGPRHWDRFNLQGDPWRVQRIGKNGCRRAPWQRRLRLFALSDFSLRAHHYF